MSECNKPHHTSKFWHSDGTIYCNDCDAEAVGMSLVVDAVKQLRTETPPVPQPHTEKQDDYTQSGDEMDADATAESFVKSYWPTLKSYDTVMVHEAESMLSDYIRDSRSHATKGKE